jgi:hypothetical protein
MTEDMEYVLNNVRLLVYAGDVLEENIPEMYEEITKLLKRSDCKVNFTKVDGSEREMRCTLRNEVLPSKLTEGATVKKTNEKNVAVWDLDKNQWRSFNTANVKKVEVIYEER